MGSRHLACMDRRQAERARTPCAATKNGRLKTSGWTQGVSRRLRGPLWAARRKPWSPLARRAPVAAASARCSARRRCGSAGTATTRCRWCHGCPTSSSMFNRAIVAAVIGGGVVTAGLGLIGAGTVRRIDAVTLRLSAHPYRTGSQRHDPQTSRDRREGMSRADWTATFKSTSCLGEAAPMCTAARCRHSQSGWVPPE